MEISVRTSLRNIIHCLELSQCLSKDLETEQQMLDKVEYRYLVWTRAFSVHASAQITCKYFHFSDMNMKSYSNGMEPVSYTDF